MADPQTLNATRLILRHRAALHGYVYACLRNHADAEDVFQEVSLAIVESIEQLENEAGFLPWAREIAFRRVLARRRKSGRERPIDPHLIGALAEAGDQVEKRDPGDDRLTALRECLEGLPARSRELVLLRYDESLEGVEEIARRVGRTVQSVYSGLKRIRSTLRDCVRRRLSSEGAR